MELGRQFKDFVTPDQVFARLENLDKRFGTSFSDPRSVERDKHSLIVGTGFLTSSKRPSFEGALSPSEKVVLSNRQEEEPDDSLYDANHQMIHFPDIETGVRNVAMGDRAYVEMFLSGNPESPKFVPPKHTPPEVIHKPEDAEGLKRARSSLFRDTGELARFNLAPGTITRVREHLRSPQIQSALRIQNLNTPQSTSGRFFEVNQMLGDIRAFPRDVLDLQTGDWAKVDPETFFPT